MPLLQGQNGLYLRCRNRGFLDLACKLQRPVQEKRGHFYPREYLRFKWTQNLIHESQSAD